tara:strand:- start:10 stop:534 length:525 start_codon:yes stop_codon:yes gene_type:complete
MASGISINKNCVEYIKKILPKGSTILELGSGEGTTWLADAGYIMYSVENQPEWFDKYPEHSTYINCRSKKYDELYVRPSEFPDDMAWYHPDDLFPNLPSTYDLILIDGPGGAGHGWGRGGFWKHIDEFNTDVPMIFDDINRIFDSEVMELVSDYVGRAYHIIDTWTGVILGKSN